MMIGSIKRHMKKVASEGRCQAIRWLTGKDGMSMVGNGGIGNQNSWLVRCVGYCSGLGSDTPKDLSRQLP